MSYDPYGCPIRFALSILGDKWTLLIVRDLMFKGRRHYSEFLTAGEGISTNILADRLARLETAGIIRKSPDPNHGKRIVYRLTDKGLDLMPVMFALMDWAEKYDERTEVPEQFIKRLRASPEALRREIVEDLHRLADSGGVEPVKKSLH